MSTKRTESDLAFSRELDKLAYTNEKHAYIARRIQEIIDIANALIEGYYADDPKCKDLLEGMIELLRSAAVSNRNVVRFGGINDSP